LEMNRTNCCEGPQLGESSKPVSQHINVEKHFTTTS
jgi:hypothetical protein